MRTAGADCLVESNGYEGEDFTFWDPNSAFVEVYNTAKILNPNIPKVNVTFGWPRINGKKPALKQAVATHPGGSAS